MHELLAVIENGETHFEIVKHENGLETLVESFDYNEYSQALKTLRDYNSQFLQACQSLVDTPLFIKNPISASQK